MHFLIHVFSGSEADVWIAESQDELGLVTEAETLDILADKIREPVPELAELNGLVAETDALPYDLLVHNHKRSPTPA